MEARFAGFCDSLKQEVIMSRVQDKKDAQGFRAPGHSPVCTNCEHFTSDKVKSSWGNHYDEKKLRCGVGGFAVKRTTSCDRAYMRAVTK
jgi:hypothetical protein